MKNLWPISLLLVLGSCATQHKAEMFYSKHPEKLAEKCAATFPVKDSVIVKNSVTFDTLYLENEPTILKDGSVKCPPAVTLIKTIMHDSVIYRRDMAAESVLQYQISDLKKLIRDYSQSLEDRTNELKQAKNTIKRKNKLILWLILILALESLYIFRKPLLKLL